ncbi:endonuclease/exonuclease/phosphatase family protein [Clostridium amazonitimonense]|uniref:endonuclease/exonuclease/phosphatase family protein n=1 Tax=Clostridium amazonitimonense TaxID=1499689 RepID=UPI000509FBA5|nr:endonuclease/exonuclease/phosphatase family protein [Clostridium amazonitimonense]
MKKLFKIPLYLIIILVAIFIIYLIAMMVTDYKPKEIETVGIENNSSEKIEKDKKYSITTMNIGYGGLDKGQDFFMDGGTGSRSISLEKTKENINNIFSSIVNKNPHFIFLQEVDKKSTRSFKFNEYEFIKDGLKEYASTFATNYKVFWVPLPLLKPHGTVNSGIANFSIYNIEKSTRYQFAGEEDKWPKYLAMLDRCFLENRLRLSSGKELILINAHLSAYDKNGQARLMQMDYLKNHVEKEYEKGNYVLVGGDFNNVMPGSDLKKFNGSKHKPEWLQYMPEELIPKNFKVAIDKNIPTNRDVNIPYTKGENFVSIIDGFMVSPNIDVISVSTEDMQFKYSDHNPVTMDFILR